MLSSDTRKSKHIFNVIIIISSTTTYCIGAYFLGLPPAAHLKYCFLRNALLFFCNYLINTTRLRLAMKQFFYHFPQQVLEHAARYTYFLTHRFYII